MTNQNTTPAITVIDAIMGSGKSTYIINHMNTSCQQQLGSVFTDKPDTTKYLVVVPLLSEVDRFTASCPSLEFHNPQPIEGKKLHHLETLVKQGRNICTTHALFTLLNQDIYNALRDQNYVLVIDEALSCVELFNDLSGSDLNTLFTQEFVYVDPLTMRLRWNHAKHSHYTGRFNDIRNLAENGNLVWHKDKILIWEFPSEFLRCFQHTFILTYLFEGSMMSSYLKAEGIKYTRKSIDKGVLVQWGTSHQEHALKKRLQERITIADGRINDIGKNGKRSNPFSSSWYKNQPRETLLQIKSSTEYFFKNIAKTGSDLNAWTCFKLQRNTLKGKRYSKGHIACNAKATNEFRHKQSLAYLCNIFQNPILKGYFESKGIRVDEELYALSEMVQWIWRSAIRDEKPIILFIPSERMRLIFTAWLNSVDTLSSDTTLKEAA